VDINSNPTHERPTPEDFLRLLRDQSRGKLKVYLGSAAGVGKNYAMLREGNRLKRSGIDVVIGYVEPHSRPETSEQIGDLEIVPPRMTNYHDIEVREMDVDAVIARKPTVALVDEFAHTNVPGSKNGKRYEDVLEILSAGISVITTLNIQHLESLCDVVESLVGVKVEERIPDSIVANADQVVDIDLAAEDLIDRVKAGKIYPPEQIEEALSNFFTEANLTPLRELALGEVAEVLERRERLSKPESSRPSSMVRIMVAISSTGLDPQKQLRKATRIASRLNAEWFAVYVRTRKEAPDHIPAELHRRLTDILEIAQKMGGTVVILKSENIVEALVNFARESGVTQIVMGKSRPRTGLRRFRASLVDQLSVDLPDVDVILC
jgi:two-component system, OmpR family, sensor histidine kinase KdpD